MMRFARATFAANTTFLELPDVDMASRISPALPIPHICCAKIISVSRSFAIAVIKDEWLTSDNAGRPY